MWRCKSSLGSPVTTGLRCSYEACHLVRGGVVEAIPISVVEETVDVGMKSLHDRPQQHRRVSFGATMRVNLDEHPFRPPFDSDGHVNPMPRSGRRSGDEPVYRR